MIKIKSCLVIENDPDDQQFFLDVLHRVSMDTGCYAVSSAAEALHVLKNQDFHPDYIFTELNLPDVDGFDFVSTMRSSEKLKRTPIIIYTSDYSEAQIDKARKAGVAAMFSKTRMPTLPSFLNRIFQNQTIL